MNLLFISHRIPYPPNKGDKIRSYHILKYLSQHHNVYLACMLDDSRDIEHLSYLRPMMKDIYYDVINPPLKKILSTIALFKRLPISIPYFYSIKLQRAIDTLLEKTIIDTIFCFSSPTAEYLFRSRHYKGKINQSKWFMDLIDMDSDKWAQYAAKTKGMMHPVYLRESKYLLIYEKRIAKEFDKLFLVSEAEKSLFLSRVPTDRVEALTNGVDLVYFNLDHPVQKNKNCPVLVFTGAMDYWPNSEGCLWFVRKVLPRIQLVFPDVELYIVGSNPPSEIRALTQQKGVNITGFVDDVRDYISMADICVVPLRIARGIQNKVLEAMAMGKPVVTTPQGHEGINATAGSELFVASDAEGFAQNVIHLLSNPVLSKSTGDQARLCIEKNYNWEKNLIFLNRLTGLHS